MCGIAGVVGMEARDRGCAMRAMRDRLVHRGPDSGGEFVDPHVALGVRRLRIVDLVTGDQPQCGEDRAVWTVFNGEVYNFRELRDELVRAGHRFATASDTEVIVHLYEAVGERFAERLEGMFAIALWDARDRTLVLARDRMGKKPLLYYIAGGDLYFASEHAALLAGISERRAVDLRGLRLYLRLGYVPAPYDAFAGVRKLPPAHVLHWRDGATTVRRYWSLPEPGTLRIHEEDALAELRGLLDRAVARRLVADVPLGALLSGGVDSSAVVASMARQARLVRTFTVGFEEEGYTEIPHARRVARLLGTEHHEFVVRASDLDVLPLLVRHYGEPYADSSALPTYHVTKLTRQHVTVALDGDGGDELFAGYDRYVAVKLASWLDDVLGAIRSPVMTLAASVVPSAPSLRATATRLRRFLRAAGLPREERYLALISIFDGRESDQLFTHDFARATEEVERSLWDGVTRPSDAVVEAQSFDLARYLPDDLLVKIDIASMANSLEVRCPFLDRELVEFAVRLPTELKLRGRRRKHLLRRLLAGSIPAENLDRRKQGFALPIASWFRGRLGAYATEVLLDSRARARGYFRMQRVARLLDEHRSGRVDHSQRLWALLTLELWHREFVDVQG